MWTWPFSSAERVGRVGLIGRHRGMKPDWGNPTVRHGGGRRKREGGANELPCRLSLLPLHRAPGLCDSIVVHRRASVVAPIVTATPATITSADTTKRGVNSSDSNETPPRAVITGTDNWTTAARVAVNPPSAAYQTT